MALRIGLGQLAPLRKVGIDAGADEVALQTGDVTTNVARSEAEAELQAKAGMPVPAPVTETEAAEDEDDGEDRAVEAPAAEAMFENAGGEESGEGAGGEAETGGKAETGGEADGDVKEEGAGGAGKTTD